MDPGAGRPSLSRSETTPNLPVGPVIFHSPFDAATEDVSHGLVRQTTIATPPALWDVAVRRFSAPSYNANRQSLVKHIDSARTAYAKAFLAIQKSTKNPNAAAILQTSSEGDVAQTALELLNQPSSTSDDRGRASRFVDVLHHYHGVFDVLSQADFSYLCVMWGGIKLVLLLAKNRKELLTKLTDMFVDIGLTLSRIEVYAKLFPTARMIELTSMLYAAVVDFLQEVIAVFSKGSTMRKMFSSLVRPFEERFGHAMARIHRLESCIEKDALLLHALQTASMAQHQLDSLLQRQHVEATLNATLTAPPGLLPQNHVPDLFLKIKDTLFHGFDDQATYHDALAATYSVTARAWEKWFAVEQRHLPSSAPTHTSLPSSSPSPSRLSQGLCDAPDYQHALQWSSQQRKLSPHIPSAYLIWAAGMTVHTAIASLIFQILQQRPTALSRHNLGPDAFARANKSVRRMWDVFVYLMRELGGCLVYISIGSAGADEFAIVERFVRTVRSWDGPPVWVTIIHPYNEGFVGIEEATDLDGLYDVHPSLTTTDALHHVLMLELDIHHVSETIQGVLWEAVWRETRYAAVGVCVVQAVEVLQREAEEVGRAVLGEDEVQRGLWMGGVQRWLGNAAAADRVRELIQRHLDIVDLALPEDIRAKLGRYLKRLVLVVDDSKADSFASRAMTQIQRNWVWDRMKAAIIPGAETMFCSAMHELVADALDVYCEVPSQNARQAGSVVTKLMNERFGMEGVWKGTMSDDPRLIERGIVEAIMSGFVDTIQALSEPEEMEQGGR